MKMHMPGKLAAALDAPHAAALDAVPGKQTLAQQLPIVELGPVHIAPFKGQRVKDGGGYEYEVTDEGSFAVVHAPETSRVPPGTVITRMKYPAAWHMLATILVASPPKAPATDSAAAPAPEATAKIDEVVPKQEAAPAEEKSVEGGDEASAAPSIDTSGGDLYWIATPNCKLRKETGGAVSPEQLLPQFMHVRVLDKKVLRDFTNAKIAKLDGTAIGWASFQHMIPLRRPARPSTASAQMAAVLAAARRVAGNEMKEECYHNVKLHILNGGGYGDILDIQQDERFVGHTVHAVNFHDAVQQHGAAALGLEQVSGLPMQATPGTLLLLRGTAKNNISTVSGDISVIDKVSGGLVHCYNDGHMKLLAKESEWSGEGHMANSFLAMYRPIDRT